MKNKWIIVSLISLFCALSLTISEARDSATVEVGSSPVVSSGGLFIAYEKGYFEEEDLTVNITYFKQSGAPMTVLLANGTLDVGGGNISAGLWNSMAQNIGIKLVADKGFVAHNADYIGLLVRSDLVTSGAFSDFSDLKGMRMAITAEGVSQQIATDAFLKTSGLSVDDVVFHTMSYSQMNVALAMKQIDATVQLEPYLTKAEMDGIAKKVAGVYSVYPDQQSAAIVYAPSFIKERPRVAKRFMVAYLKGVRDYVRAFHYGVHKEEIVRLLKKHIAIEDDALWNAMIPVGLNPDGYLNRESLERDLSWYQSKKLVTGDAHFNQAIDHSYVDYAIAEIGPFKAEE
jgi:NitT/TauT family transport system substrate-binding protein